MADFTYPGFDPPVTVGMALVRTCGTVGITTALGDELGEVPIALVAVTVNVYAVPLLSPMTVQARAPVVVQVLPPGLEVTVYPVTEEPPVEAGAVHDTTT
nr:hypothetical protein [Knoellia flava]